MNKSIRRKPILNPISVTVLLVLLVTNVVLYFFTSIGQVYIIAGILVSALVASSIRIADQWEKAVVLRMGKFVGLRGPGLFFIIPILDRVDNYIDQRVRLTDFKAEETLTKDTVPVNVDAVVYWTVWDVEKSALEVQNYISAVSYIAQTGLRDIIGKHELADLLQNRERIAEALQSTLDEHTNPWGITCQTVGIKDIVFPEALADAMSKQAQAERERQARIILGTAETEISEKFKQASQNYHDNPVALQLRGMNMLFEGLKEKGSLVIVPSSALESMNLGAIGGLTALAESQANK
ncbi:slipin family protein [candidate division KSB1 bacterium]|nr:slipin family protein [candidate division KSB1 bacterium]MBL7094642.1 slipin family protein [candidate division KSB1 bacterium]